MSKTIDKIKDRMLLGSIYDQIMKHTRYHEKPLDFLYNVMVGQKHRMLYYKKLKKQYFAKCVSHRPWENLPKESHPENVWILWFTGMDTAPEIVRQCFESVKKHMPDRNIVVLDENNYRDYVELPEYILEKYHKGIIKDAHLSDIIRMEILIRYGGYWIDSTVFVTDDSMIRKIEDQDLFMYSFYDFGFDPEIMTLNNWFIYSRTNNNILNLTLKLLYSYWRDYDRTINYFFFHIFLTMVTEFYKDEYEKMPIVSQVPSHVLATYIYDDFDKNKYEILKETTGIHKLSTRFDTDKLQKEGTFYDIVIRRGNE